jgi:hypothetical protein
MPGHADRNALKGLTHFAGHVSGWVNAVLHDAASF